MNNKNMMMAIGLLIAAVSVKPAPAAAPKSAANQVRKQCTSVVTRDTVFVTLGKSAIIPLDGLKRPITRVVVDGPTGMIAPSSSPAPGAPATTENAPIVGDTDVIVLSQNDLVFRGKKAGATNVILQDSTGACFVQDILVSLDYRTVQSKISELMPEEKDVQVKSAENAIVLTGKVEDSTRLDEVMRIATAYGDGKRVVNLLRVNANQQVMLEVKIAEVSKTLLDKFGIDFARLFTTADGMTSRVISGIFGGGPAVFGRFHPNAGGGTVIGNVGSSVSGGNTGAGTSMSTAGNAATLIGIDAEKKDGLVRVLAEPNIMAISGQSASFLSGGKIFIPVAQSNLGGGVTITLEEKEFGVGLKFTPTVLGGNRVNLKLVSEVSELSQTGSPFTTNNGVTSVLPSITTRRVDTTVQLKDGQSFAVAGLIRNNVTETIKRFPGLGEVPILGMLFRSSEFQKDQTELVFIVTPRMVKPLAEPVMLPTDSHVEPNRADAVLMGRTEGSRTAPPAPKK
ncbi:type II and III secretion system protein family protein [Pseudoduganella sp. GCM10020061]|uniref:type II and III secretion system protein family protein n=1 Tax=Pseudoduganella sp. GCM10020061 TaxID=3317345 RepID=UPI003643C9E6